MGSNYKIRLVFPSAHLLALPAIMRELRLLSWTPHMPLKEGFIRTISYFEKLVGKYNIRNC